MALNDLRRQERILMLMVGESTPEIRTTKEGQAYDRALRIVIVATDLLKRHHDSSIVRELLKALPELYFWARDCTPSVKHWFDSAHPSIAEYEAAPPPLTVNEFITCSESVLALNFARHIMQATAETPASEMDPKSAALIEALLVSDSAEYFADNQCPEHAPITTTEAAIDRIVMRRHGFSHNPTEDNQWSTRILRKPPKGWTVSDLNNSDNFVPSRAPKTNSRSMQDLEADESIMAGFGGGAEFKTKPEAPMGKTYDLSFAHQPPLDWATNIPDESVPPRVPDVDPHAVIRSPNKHTRALEIEVPHVE
jgi:hypothetical protein